MIIRLKVKGFKNLNNVELNFGPFTCIAGTNGVGKSNLFDAIKFLSAVANYENTLTEAAFLIRDEKNKKRTSQDLRNLFYHNGQSFANRIDFEVDMIIPEMGIDHLGQRAEATTTILTYRLSIGYKLNNTESAQSSLEIILEELIPLKKIEIKKQLQLMGATNDWINSVIKGKRQNSTPFIKTESNKIVTISQDQVRGGRKKTLKIDQLPRTVISTATALENPTMLIAKNELISWSILQLEPSALRSPDDLTFTENPKISAHGEHLPATLYRLINNKNINYDVKAQLSNRLSQLIDDVFNIYVDKDDKRDILTLMVKSKNKTPFPARSLSDGTLRFIALSIIQADPETQGIICLEEPENGIHPERIPAIISLLQDIACDIREKNDTNNPLRQVIINTHSPIVVSEIPDSSLLLADFESINDNKSVKFLCLPKTWRSKGTIKYDRITKNYLLSYLNPYDYSENFNTAADADSHPYKKVLHREELKQLSLFNS